MVFDKQFFAKHQSKLLWIANHRWTRWLLGLNRIPKSAYEKEGFTGRIDLILPASIHWKTGKLLKKKINRKGFRPKEVLVEEWKRLAFTRPRFAEALAYNLSPFCYFANFQKRKMVFKFSPVGVLGILATILLPKFFGGIAFVGATDYPSGAGDGYAGNADNTAHYQVWADVRSDSAGNFADYTGTTAEVEARLYSTWYYILRAFAPFDTSGIDDSSTVTAGVLHLVTNVVYNSPSIGVVQTTQASTSAVVADDFDQCGALNSPDEGASRFTPAAAGNDNAIALNATGLAWISKTGYTKLGFREAHDIDNSAPSTDYDFTFRTSEYTGSANDPYLAVTTTNVYTLNCSEDLTLTDSLIKQISKPLTETLSFADTFLKSLTRSFLETLSLSDTFTKLKLYFKQLTETFSLTDTLQRVTTKVLQEAINLAAAISFAISRAFSETVNLTDTIIKKTFKVFSETVILTDNIIKTIAKSAFSEIVLLTDALSKLQSKVISETLTMTDTITKKIHKTFTETITLTDVLKILKNGLSVLWAKVPRPLSGGWSKQSRQTDDTWHKQARP